MSGPAGSSPDNFLQLSKANFLGSAPKAWWLPWGGSAVDPIQNDPEQQPPRAPGGSWREPTSHPTSTRNPRYLPTGVQT